ncbi:MAG: sensor histidine kinase [Bacilli bacterium]
MRRSIGTTFFIAYCSFVVLLFGLLVLFNMTLLEPYYKWSRLRTIDQETRQIATTLERNEVDKMMNYAYHLFVDKNMTIDIYDRELALLYSNALYGEVNQETQGLLPNTRWTQLQKHMQMSMDVLERSVASEQLSKNKLEKYSMFDEATKTSYIGAVYATNGSHYIVARSSLTPMRESIAIVNQFLLVGGSVLVLIGIFLSILVARYFQKPIIRLQQMAAQMTKRNFTDRWPDTTRNDELGMLGQSMNELSSMLTQFIDEIQMKNRAIEEELVRKEQDEARKKAFISDVSHELKTPIALIQGYAEGLQYNIHADPKKQQEYAAVIVDESQKMSKLVNELLLLSRFDAGQERRNDTEFDIVPLVTKIVQRFEDYEGMQRFEIGQIILSDEAIVCADAFKIEQVITNFMTNAMKYADEAKQVILSVRVESGEVYVQCWNSSPPIPENDQTLIWDSFYRRDKARSRSGESTGLGLAIVQKIVDLHGGRCGTYNTVGGVVFWFSLGQKCDNR